MADGDRYTLRSELLKEAERIITQERNKSYGEPDEDFQRIAAIADGMGFRFTAGEITRHLTGSDVALFMICLKLSRLGWMSTHQDSWMDIAGYAACGFETAVLSEERAAALQPLPISAEPAVTTVGDVGPIPLPRDVQDAVKEALQGSPAHLEGMGYFLGDAATSESWDCQSCENGHTLRSPCRYRVKRRRNDG